MPARFSMVVLTAVALGMLPAAAQPDARVTATQEGSQVVFRAGRQEMFRYQGEAAPLPRPDIRPEFRRGGYVSPLFTPTGTLVSDDFPPNHVHHHGLWWAWTKTDFRGSKPDFWNMGDRTGRVEFVALERLWESEGAAGLTARHRFVSLLTTPPTAVLEEIWEIRATAPVAGRPRFLLDLASTQTCATPDPLHLPPYHYGGLGFRGRRDWDGTSHCSFLTSEGITDRVQGNTSTARWLWIGGPPEHGGAGLAILSHPENFRAPQPLRLHPTEPFVCWAPVQAGAMTITPATSYVSRYRLVLADGRPKPEEIESWWTAYAGTPRVPK